MLADLLNSTAAAQFILAGLWQGLLLVSVAWLALEALPGARSRLTPGTRFSLWMNVFLLAALVPFSALAVSGHGEPLAATASAVGTAAHFPAAQLPARWAAILACLWALASLLAMARLLVNLYSLGRLARSAAPMPAERLDQELLSLLQKPGSRPVRLCLSSRVDSPAAIGFFRPAIVIPRWLEAKLSSPELTQVVTHELAHLERRDNWTNLLQKFVRALFPLNPALVWAERQLCREREMACDDRVLAGSASPHDYAVCLTSLAEKRLLRGAPTLAPGAWQRRSELAGRISRILRQKPLAGGEGRGARVAAAAFLGVSLCGGMALARCPQLVTFTEQASQPKNSESASQPKSSEPTALRVADSQVNPPAADEPGAPAFLQRSKSLRVPLELNSAATPKNSGFARLNKSRVERKRAFSQRLKPIEVATAYERVQRQDLTPDLAARSLQKPLPEAQIIITVWEIAPGIPPTRSGWIIFEL